MDLILIRHPAVGVPTGICYGRSDVPLAADPSPEVQRCLNRIGTLSLCDPVGAVHASVLSRCTQIAAPLAAHFNVVMQADSRLREIDFGRWEMQAWEAIDRGEIDAWAQDLENARVHGGESVAMLALRVGAWLKECETSEVADENSAGRPVVVIAHAGVIRVLTALALRLPLATCVDWHLPFGGLSQLRYNVSQKRWTLVTWNGV